MNTIKMSAYDVNTNPIDDVLSKDGLQFKYSKPFFLVANYPAKNKTMFELSVTHYYPINGISHIPLYVGITKEPSIGVMIASFCISSLYTYSDNPKYDIISNTGLGSNMHKYIDGGSEIVGTRKPGADYNVFQTAIDTVGVAADFDNNRIYLYVNYDESSDEYNHPFYYYDVPFSMRDIGDIYFCIYSDISYLDTLEDGLIINSELDKLKYISGIVNFGRYGLRYPVSEFSSLYAAYYESSATSEIYAEIGTTDKPCSIVIGGDSFLSYTKQIDTNVNIENELIPSGDDLKLTSPDSTYVEIENEGLRYIMAANEHITADKDENGNENQYASTNSGEIGSNVFINYPIPTNEKIYFEFTANDGINRPKVIGIPLSLGVASIGLPVNKVPSHELAITPITIHQESYRANLYRGSPYQTAGLAESGGNYIAHIIMNNLENNNKSDFLYLNDVKISYPLAQGSTIGVALDLANNKMTIISNNEVFANVTIPADRKNKNLVYADFSNLNRKNGKMEYAYFFLHDEGMYRGIVDGMFNFGKTTFSYDIPDGYMSLYDFYNVNKTRIIDKDLDGSITIISNKIVNSYLYGKLRINRVSDIEYGINRLIMSDNIITDDYDDYYKIDDKSFRAMNELISQENHGYMPEFKERSLNVSFTGVPKYTINLAQYETQEIYVYVNNNPIPYRGSETPTITVNENSLIHVKCVALNNKNKYAMFPGEPSVTKAIVASNLFITASPASYMTYNVVIADSPNQKITVYNYNSDDLTTYTKHTNSFMVNSRYPYIKAEITKVNAGYTKGVIMPATYQSLTKISSDVMIYATSVGNVRYTITLAAAENEYIEATYQGKTSYSAGGEVRFSIGYNKPVRITVKPYSGYVAGRAYYYDENHKKVYIATAIGGVTSDMTIYAEPAQKDYISVLVDENKHAVTEVSGYVTRNDNLYKVETDTPITVTTKPEDGYFFDHYEIITDDDDESVDTDPDAPSK